MTGRGLKDHGQGHFPLVQVVQSPIQLGLGHFQGWGNLCQGLPLLFANLSGSSSHLGKRNFSFQGVTVSWRISFGVPAQLLGMTLIPGFSSRVFVTLPSLNHIMNIIVLVWVHPEPYLCFVSTQFSLQGAQRPAATSCGFQAATCASPKPQKTPKLEHFSKVNPPACFF